MVRDEFIKQSTEFAIAIEKLQQEYFQKCYLSEVDIKRLFPHGTKVEILPNRESVYIRNSKETKRQDPNKIVGKVGEIDLTFNVYSESYINVKFVNEDNVVSRQLVPYCQLKVV